MLHGSQQSLQSRHLPAKTNDIHRSSVVGGWTNPFKKYIVAKLDHIPKYKGGEKPFETTT